MRNLNFLKLFYGLMLVMVSTAFVSCVDDNDDTEAPYLEVSPTTLIFGSDGQPANGSQASFDISTNRSWKATVKDDKSWVTLSKYEGEGSATIQVSIPENVNDEASVVIEISNKVGVLMSETVKISSGSVGPTEVIYNETVGNKTVSNPYPFVDSYDGWNKSGIGSTNVTYSGASASVRASGLANSGAYDGASGPNVVFFGSLPAYFQINKIALTEAQTNLKLTFGASYSIKVGEEYDNTFDTSKLTVALSADGTNWVPLTYTKNNGDSEKPYWVLATANFTLKKAVSELYIKYTALAASSIRLDDITLATGAGGTEVDLEGGEEPEPGEAKVITIPELNAMMTTTQTPVDETADRYFEAVVQNDVEGGNYSFNNLILTTENSTVEGNGITLFGSQVEPSKLNLNKGDKVKVTLYKGLAKTVNYNGMFEVTGGKDDTWAKVEKIGTAAITPVTITADKLADYQGMPVIIVNATPKEGGVWAKTEKISSHTFTAGGTDFVVFCKKEATAFIDKTYKVTTGNISGLAAVNSNKGQLVPRNMEDVNAFNSTEPTIVSVDPSNWTFPATGGNKEFEVSVANMGSNTLTTSGLNGILSATVNGTKVTVTANGNSTTNDIKQTLKISLANSEIEVPITVSAPSSSSDTEITLTADEISKMTNGGYATFDYDNTYGKWTGKCGITSTGANAPYLQINFNSSSAKTAFNSHIQIPKVNGIIQKIVVTTAPNTVAKRYILACAAGYTYEDGTTQAQLDEIAKAKSNESTDKGQTFTIDNIENLNLSELSIFPGGGAVYINSITITYKK